MGKLIRWIKEFFDPKWITFAPKEDITAQELSKLLPYLTGRCGKVPDNLLKHFKQGG